ncbi:hypothetical protein [Herbidospora daliensis]|uniref:hypothetical protein n=1 Tax=Herbidospora daliensis TaxID=295585 RepID=UPI0012F8F5F2|nr:hypothetical protein [Herbidospora daliensis]
MIPLTQNTILWITREEQKPESTANSTFSPEFVTPVIPRKNGLTPGRRIQIPPHMRIHAVVGRTSRISTR